MLGLDLPASGDLLDQNAANCDGREGVIETAGGFRCWPVAGLAAIAALAAAIFALDLATPRGVIEGALYAVLVLASAWLPWPKAPVGAGVFATLLDVAGYVASAGSVVPGWLAVTNRIAAVAVIWTTALLLYRRLKAERALAASQARYQALLAERALQESQDRYRQLIEASPDAIIVHRDDFIRFVNPGAVALFGATDAAALIGRPLLEFLPDAKPAEGAARDIGSSPSARLLGRRRDWCGLTGACSTSRSAASGSRSTARQARRRSCATSAGASAPSRSSPGPTGW